MINFVNPRSPFLEKDAMMPPLGLFYLVAVLRQAGIKAQVVDLGLGDFIPDGPIFTTGTSAQKEEVLKLRRGNSVLGGPLASIEPDKMNKHFPTVVVGEGEELIEHLVKDRPKGIIKAKRITKLDRLPFPDRSQADRYHWEIGGRKATTMVTSRGCTGKCAFCCKAVTDHGVFFRSAQNVIEEVIHIKAMGFGAVMFYDDSMAMIRPRLVEICKGLKDLGMVWRCFARSDQVDYELLSLMAASGCYEILFGIESGSNQILKNIRKHETREQHIKAIISAKKAGIKVKALMIVGLPGESPETIRESESFIRATKPDSLDITVLSVYKGSDIYNNPLKYDIRFTEPTWYKGREGEYQCSVETSKMSSNGIIRSREMLWKTFKSL